MESVANTYSSMRAIGAEVATEVVKEVVNDADYGVALRLLLLLLVLLLFFFFVTVVNKNYPKPA